MVLSGSEDEPDPVRSGSESDSLTGDSSLDLDPSEPDDVTDDSSEDEWNRTPTKRRASAKRCCTPSASPRSASLKSPPRRWGLRRENGRSPRKRNHNESTPTNNHSSPKTVKTSSPCRKHQPGARGEDEGEDGDRWRDVDEQDVEPPQPRFRPERAPGPQLSRTATYTPLELFQLFFSTAVIDTLVRNTNAYWGRKHDGRQPSWLPVTSADMYSFLSLVLYMGIAPLKTLADFWRGTKLFNLPFPASVMPRRRFLAISRALHMNDPATEAANDLKRGTPGYDKLCKIRPLYEQILEACHTFFHPYQHISIDERMVASKARIGLKQYVKNKPTKWGFKLFVLADSACGYTQNFFVYAGREGTPTGKGRSYDVVMRLLDIPFLGKGYKLYVDNFYTSPTLFLDLLSRKIWACGTVRPNVAGYPKKKHNDMTNRTPRGTIRWIRRDKLLFVKWLDTRQVTMCSTLHKAYSNDTATRKVKEADGRWAVKQVPIPGSIKDYNQHMGGVDLSDALISYYNVLHKTRKWYKTLFYHFVDIATVNAFILHKQMCKLHNRPELRQKTFREQLIVSLAEIGSTPRRAAPYTFTTFPCPVPALPPSNKEATASSSGAPGLGHLPAYFAEQMSNVSPRYRATAGRRACVLCKRKSPVFCGACQKTLCFTSVRNCYSEWHRSNGVCA
ncbi:piggyBac transposable element-derived protein 4-like [Antennarius striatus]|uniref:piggyBac transposable element-derived protein 4-like n=1 Tax=Antennarius striatus TaxID=241820 RepID=UPI0035B14BCF